jgi:hypothetical protein
MTEEFIDRAIDKLFIINNNSLIIQEFSIYLEYKTWFIKTLKKHNNSYTKRDLLRIWNEFEEKYFIYLKIKNHEYTYEQE